MKWYKKLELEHKLLGAAFIFFVAFIWPVQHFFITRLNTILAQGIDPKLETLLRSQLLSANSADSISIVHSIERVRQWKALIPTLVNEQRMAVIFFSLIIFLLLSFVAYYALKRLTLPIKNLATALTHIGSGEPAGISDVSGGALGRLEKSVIDLEEELVLLREKTRIAGMESAWQDIASVMAHEIKNPLTPMRLTLDRVLEKAENGIGLDAHEVTKYVQRLNAQVDALEHLVNQFRSFSKEPEATPKNFDIKNRILKTMQSFSDTMTLTITGLGNVYADPYLFDQVLLNLAKNALEAGSETFSITITEKDNLVLIACKDNGTGISDSDIQRIWLPYVSLKKGGTGLGLPVVRKLIETMNGTVSLTSKTFGDNRGTRVLFTLPKSNNTVENRQ